MPTCILHCYLRFIKAQLYERMHGSVDSLDDALLSLQLAPEAVRLKLRRAGAVKLFGLGWLSPGAAAPITEIPR